MISRGFDDKGYYEGVLRATLRVSRTDIYIYTYIYVLEGLQKGFTMMVTIKAVMNVNNCYVVIESNVRLAVVASLLQVENFAHVVLTEPAQSNPPNLLPP